MMRYIFAIAIFGFMSQPVMAKVIGKASFLAIGEGLAIDIEAKDAPIDGTVKNAGGKLSGTFTVNLKDFKTGIGLRDEHMCKALECDKYPRASFTLDSFNAGDGEKPFSGMLLLHGVKKPFVGRAKVKGSEVKASGKLLLTDYGITPPEYKLARVKNEVEVQIDIAL